MLRVFSWVFAFSLTFSVCGIANSNQSNYLTSNQGEIIWEFETSYQLSTSVSIAADGTLFLSSSVLYALNPDGSLKWEYDAGSSFTGSPMVGSDQRIYAGTSSGKMICLNEDGDLIWSYNAGKTIKSTPSIDFNNNICFGCENGYVYSVSPDGTLNWKVFLGESVDASPSIGPNGNIYIGSTNNYFYAISPDGNIRWSFAAASDVASSAAISRSGTIYFASLSKLYALSPLGNLEWQSDIGSFTRSSPCIDEEGNIYVGSWDKNIYSISPDGTINWTYPTSDWIDSSPCIDKNGNVYIGSYDGYLYSLSADGKLNWKSYFGDDVRTSPAISSNGTLYLGSDNRKLLAISTGGVGSLTSAWSCFKGNMAKTGNFEQVYVDGVKAGMSFSADKGVPPCTIDFFDASFGDITNWYWDFGDGSISTDQNPKHTYLSNGEYSVSLIVANDSLSDTLIMNKAILISDQLVEAGFSASVNKGVAPLAVAFVNQSVGKDLLYSWSFGDGAVSSEKEPSHTFNFAGDFLVTLIVSNETGSDTTFSQITVNGDWTYVSDQYIMQAPATDGDGNIYFVSGTNLKSIDSSGKYRWKRSFDIVTNAPTVANDSLVLLGGGSVVFPVGILYGLYAYDKKGSYQWKYQTSNRIESSPAVGEDGSIYFGCDDQYFYALNANGKLKWRYYHPSDSRLMCSPIIGVDGTIYYSGIKAFYALNPDGTLKWKADNHGGCLTPAINYDGSILNPLGYYLEALKPDGSVRWTATIDDGYTCSPSIDDNGCIYIGGVKGDVTVLNQDGSLKWRKHFSDKYLTGLTIGADHRAYFGSRDSTVYAIDLEGNLQWKYKVRDRIEAVPVINKDGLLLVGGIDKTIYAFNTHPKAENKAIWPCIQQNSQHTGSLEIYKNEITVADFVADTTVGRKGLIVQFTNLSSNSPDSCFWNFGDGISSTEQNPIHTYNELGKYSVKLTVKKGKFSSETSKTDYVEIKILPIWTFKTENKIWGTPALDDNGNLYFATRFGYFFAVEKNGHQLWMKDYNANIWSSPSIDASGAIYFGAQDSKVYAIQPDSTEIWSYETGDFIYSSMAISADGTLYIGSEDHFLYAFNTDGTVKWKFNAGDGIVWSTPTIGVDGTIYFGADNNIFYALNRDASVKWQYKTDHRIWQPAVINTDGSLYIGCDGQLLALSAEGEYKWSATTWSVAQAPVIGADGTLYFGDSQHFFYAINPDGSNKWSLQIGNVSNSAAIGRDGTIFVGTLSHMSPPYSQGNFFALSPEGEILWQFENLELVSSPVIADDGIVYISGNENLYAFETDCGGLANTPWPCFMKDRKHTNSLWEKKVGPPVAEFSVSPDSGSYPLEVHFTDFSESSIESWLWDFGDGIVSREQSPTHLYESIGDYTVSLVVSNSSGSDSIVKEKLIKVVEPLPVAVFAASPDSGSYPLEVKFTDLSENTLDSWDWDFGDGTSSSEQSPIHQYESIGEYTVSLVVSNSSGSDSLIQENLIRVSEPLPIAAFAASPDSGSSPLEVQFTDLSENTIERWAWDFGDGENSIEQNPFHTYVSEGVFTVKLTVANSSGEVSISKENCIVVSKQLGIYTFSDKIYCIFYPNPTHGLLNVKFFDGQKPESIFIFDEKGRKVMEFSELSKEKTIDLLGLKAGIYYLSTNNRFQKIHKIIKF